MVIARAKRRERVSGWRRMPRLQLPPLMQCRADLGGNVVEQWTRSSAPNEYTLAKYRLGTIKGLLLTESESGNTTLVVPEAHTPSRAVNAILLCPKPERLLSPGELHLRDARVKWLSPATAQIDVGRIRELTQAAADARSSWKGAWRLSEAGSLAGNGLHPSQSGAVHAVLAHWAVNEGGLALRVGLSTTSHKLPIHRSIN